MSPPWVETKAGAALGGPAACQLSRVISRAKHTVSIKTRFWMRRWKEREKVLFSENPMEVIPKSEVRGVGRGAHGQVEKALLSVNSVRSAADGRKSHLSTTWPSGCVSRAVPGTRSGLGQDSLGRKPDHPTPQSPGDPLGRLCELSPGARLRGSALGCRAEGFSLWALRSRVSGQAT